MKKLSLLLSLVPSVALAHPGHDDVGVGGTPINHALVTNPVLVLAILAVVMLVVVRIARMVRK